MKSILSLIVASTVLAQGSFAAPAPTDSSAFSDTLVLQYALTLEHLENAFYSGGLTKFKQSDFADADEYARFQEISGHEATHVNFLTKALGADAVAPCNYSFPYTDIASFKALAMVLEGVGVTAYLGAAGFITNKDYLTAAGSILTTEARHASYLGVVNGKDSWSGAFDTPLSPNNVFSLAAGFITGCPASNPTLPVKAFPALTVANSPSIASGSQITLTVPAGFNATGSMFVAFLNGDTKTFVGYNVNQSVTIPAPVEATGPIYALITSSNTSTADADTLAGPAILAFAANNTGSGSGSSSGGSSSGSGSSSTGGTKSTTGAAGLSKRSMIAGGGWVGFAVVVGLLL